jgi:hypothetical protein
LLSKTSKHEVYVEDSGLSFDLFRAVCDMANFAI